MHPGTSNHSEIYIYILIYPSSPVTASLSLSHISPYIVSGAHTSVLTHCNQEMDGVIVGREILQNKCLILTNREVSVMSTLLMEHFWFHYTLNLKQNYRSWAGAGCSNMTAITHHID